MSYPVLKKLKLDVALKWFIEDSKDDFFPDLINWKDLSDSSSSYLARLQHKIFQSDLWPSSMEYIPKKNRMLREAIWINPSQRLVYLAILHHFIGKVNHRLCHEVYSYRLDGQDSEDAYPFGKRMDRWKDFHNDFRNASLQPDCKAVLVTDLASFYDHIQADNLKVYLKSILAGNFSRDDETMANHLVALLKQWGSSGFGMPHNLDASSFFCNVYLHSIDKEMTTKRYQYFRWMDDIRIVVKSKEQAVRALHDLQQALLRERLFLSSEKTKIIERADPEFDSQMNVEDDVDLSGIEEDISSGQKKRVERAFNSCVAGLKRHSGKDGDDRKFRAYANRLLDVGAFSEYHARVDDELLVAVLPKLRDFPERNDYWTKLLSGSHHPDVVAAVEELLVTKPSMFDWQRFHLWRLGMTFKKELVSAKLIERAHETATNGICDSVSAVAVLFLGKFLDHDEKEVLFSTLFNAQRPYVVQRALLIATSDSPIRDQFHRCASDLGGHHEELIRLICLHESLYELTEQKRSVRNLKSEPEKPMKSLNRGIGLVKGKIVRYRLARRDYDYE